MLLPNRHSSDDYRYGFQGQEKDDEIKGDDNHIAFGDYGLDVRSGRRFQTDPITNPSISPFAVFNNNPIYFIDPKGLSPDDWIKDKNGKYVWDGNVTKKSETPEGYEHVGASLNDVFKDYTENNKIAAFFGGVPDFGANRTKWHGEINTPQDHSSFGFNWSYLANSDKAGENFIFEVSNGFNILAEMAKGHQAGVDMVNLDGTPTGKIEGVLGLLGTALFFTPIKGTATISAEKAEVNTLIHYTTESGYNSIMESLQLFPSVGAKNARYGSGQYFTDIFPGTATAGEVSARLFRVPWNGQKITHFLEIDITGLEIIKNKPFNYLVPNTSTLNLEGRIINGGKSEFLTK